MTLHQKSPLKIEPHRGRAGLGAALALPLFPSFLEDIKKDMPCPKLGISPPYWLKPALQTSSGSAHPGGGWSAGATALPGGAVAFHTQSLETLRQGRLALLAHQLASTLTPRMCGGTCPHSMPGQCGLNTQNSSGLDMI